MSQRWIFLLKQGCASLLFFSCRNIKFGVFRAEILNLECFVQKYSYYGVLCKNIFGEIFTSVQWTVSTPEAMWPHFSAFQKKGWVTATGQPVKNKDDLLVLDRIMQENKGLQIKYGSILWSPFDLCHSGKLLSSLCTLWFLFLLGGTMWKDILMSLAMKLQTD